VTDWPGAEGGAPEPDLDLCEYVIVAAPALEELEPLADAVGELVGSGAVRLLDAAALARPAGGTTVLSHEVDDVPALGRLAAAVDGPPRLSQHDLQLAGVTLQPGSAAVLLLIEDRWAGTLSAAVRDIGGQVAGGERIGRNRLRAQLEQPEEARPYRPDLLVRLPACDTVTAGQQIDPTDQIRAMADLVDDGVLSLEQYEVQRRRVLDG